MLDFVWFYLYKVILFSLFTLFICKNMLHLKSSTVIKVLGESFHQPRSRYDTRRQNYSNDRSWDARRCVKRRDFVLKIATLYNFVRKSDIRREGGTLCERLSVVEFLVLRNEREDVAKEAQIYQRRTHCGRKRNRIIIINRLNIPSEGWREKNANAVKKDFHNHFDVKLSGNRANDSSTSHLFSLFSRYYRRDSLYI